MPYDLSGYDRIAPILAGPASDGLKDRTLKAIELIAEDPADDEAMPVPGSGLPRYVWTVVAGDEMVALTYVVLGPPLRAVRFLKAELITLWG